MYYGQLEQDRRSSQARHNLEREISITCNEVVGSSLAESSRKRKSEVSLFKVNSYCNTNIIVSIMLSRFLG